MIVAHDVNLATPEGTSHINAIRHAAQEVVKGTMPAGSKLRHIPRNPDGSFPIPKGWP
jgi:hypothetical protein